MFYPAFICLLATSQKNYSTALGTSAPTEGREGRGHIVAAARLQLVLYLKYKTQSCILYMKFFLKVFSHHCVNVRTSYETVN